LMRLRAASNSIVVGHEPCEPGALSTPGIRVTPAALRIIFTAVRTFFAVRYWQKQLRGELGNLSLGSHIAATFTTEFPALAANVKAILAQVRMPPELAFLLSQPD
ncbi:MAG: hypothetical protein ABI137_05205, partial [Antricoccus sp.]